MLPDGVGAAIGGEKTLAQASVALFGDGTTGEEKQLLALFTVRDEHGSDHAGGSQGARPLQKKAREAVLVILTSAHEAYAGLARDRKLVTHNGVMIVCVPAITHIEERRFRVKSYASK